MVSSSSSGGQEFQTANPSPEHQGTSIASSREYYSAPEQPSISNPFQLATTPGINTQHLSLPSRSPSKNTRPGSDVRGLPLVTLPSAEHSTLRAAAPVFVPRTHVYQAPTQPVPMAWPYLPTPPSRPPYDNQVPGIPSHWIPIYGSGHGIFYDPLTKLFYNDGPPRPTLVRPDGTMQPMDDSTHVHPIGFQPEDVLFLQPPSITEPIVRAMAANPHAIQRFYCRCQDAWLATPHNCPVGGTAPEPSMAPAPSLRAAPLAIRPMDVIPPESFTHDLVVGDLSYLTLEQRYVYERGQAMGMRAAGLSGGAFMPGWVGSGGTEEWIANEQEESRIARKRRVRARRLVAGWGARN